MRAVKLCTTIFNAFVGVKGNTTRRTGGDVALCQTTLDTRCYIVERETIDVKNAQIKIKSVKKRKKM